MAEYKVIYPFEVLDYLKRKKDVYVLDREALTVDCIETLSVGDFTEILEKAEKEKSRFEFWVRQVTEVEAV